MENKNFCIRPFNSVHVGTGGAVRTCCYIKPNLSDFEGSTSFNIHNNTINDFWNSDYTHYVQEQFLKGNTLKECAFCHRSEKQDIKSERQLANKHYGIIGNKNPNYYLKHLKKFNLEHPEDYNLDITNLCNLKCYMCTGSSSSKLLIENNALGLEKLDQKDFDVSEPRLDALIEEIVENNVTNITLQGGEPLLNPKIISMLERLGALDTAKNLSIWITTNATQYTDKLFETLSKFKTVKIIFSIDGVGKTNEYLRYPSRWIDIENNVKKFRILKNATFQISFTVQGFNILDIKNIINFSNTYKIHLKLGLLYIPSYLKLNVLPKQILQTALDSLNTIQDSDVIHVTNFYGIKSQIESALENPSASEKDLDELITIIGKRDAYRKTSIKNYLPEIAKCLNI